ncbi:hypothetical protein Tco_0392701 [Tanacetum coccineum]
MRNKMFLHIARNDSILGPMRFVSRSDDFQVYGALLPKRMTNQQIWDSDAYKTYLAYDTDTPGVSVSKKKAPKKVARSKGIKLLSDAALLKEAQLKNTLKRSKRETSIHKARGSSEGADFESKGDSYDEENEQSDGKEEQSDDDHEQANDEWTKSDDEEEETQDDEYVHTLDDYVPTEDEMKDETNDVTEEEYERINEELYGDVNVKGASNQVKDDAQATETSEGPIPSSSISSNYAAKYINFHNIPLVDTEVVFMFDINVQHEVPRTSPLFTIPVLTDLEKDVKELKDVDNSTKFISKIQSKVPKAVKEYLGSSLDDAMHKVIWKNVNDIIKEHSFPAETVERLRHQYAP